MKVAVFGSNGFIGSHVTSEVAKHHDVVALSRNAEDPDLRADLSDAGSVKRAMERHAPDAVINCAGIIDPTRADLNVQYTRNLFDGIEQSDIIPDRIITTGSAAVYGQVDSLPVREDVEHNPGNDYGRSKSEEETMVLERAREIGTQAVVARVFNPIGPNMPDRMLIPNLLRQAEDIKAGNRNGFEISRLDSERDFIDVRDLARAYVALLVAELSDEVYNIGTGNGTPNAELLRAIKRLYDLADDVEVNETVETPESRVASQADVSRLKRDTDWEPTHTIDDTMKDIFDGKTA